jgi:hypothetical protein
VEEGKLELKIQVCHDAAHVAHALDNIAMNKCKFLKVAYFPTKTNFWF